MSLRVEGEGGGVAFMQPSPQGRGEEDGGGSCQGYFHRAGGAGALNIKFDYCATSPL